MGIGEHATVSYNSKIFFLYAGYAEDKNGHVMMFKEYILIFET